MGFVDMGQWVGWRGPGNQGDCIRNATLIWKLPELLLFLPDFLFWKNVKFVH